MSEKPTPTRYGDREVYSVAGFNRGVASWIDRLPEVWVEGEIAELKHQQRWSFAYLTLKDPADGSVLSAQVPRARMDAVTPPLKPGDRVHVLGRGGLFEKRGEFRFRITAVEQFGLGLVLRQIEELRRRLADEGLFAAERKRPLPRLPRVIGLICGSDAAAKRDVVETATARYPPARFEVVEVAVQGARAPQQLVAALRRLDADPSVDVIVLARGGGSFEDLLPFSDERVCRAVAACATPVVSAVGHEQDHPLVDLAADVRAGTPSLAARLIVPEYARELEALDEMLARAARALEAGAGRARRTLDLLVTRPAFADPMTWITVRRLSLERSRDWLLRWPAVRMERESTRLAGAHARLRLLGPAATLERGYAIVQNGGGGVVRDSAGVEVGDRVGIRLSRGRLGARVEEVET